MEKLEQTGLIEGSEGACPRWHIGKESACRFRRHKRLGFDPWVGKMPWRRKWQTTPIFLPGTFCGQRSLVGYSPWGSKQSDTTEQTSTEIESEVAPSCPALCNPVDYTPPGSSIHGIFQARVLEWGAISFSRGSSQPRDWNRASHIVDRGYLR